MLFLHSLLHCLLTDRAFVSARGSQVAETAEQAKAQDEKDMLLRRVRNAITTMLNGRGDAGAATWRLATRCG